jgi:CMP-N-acetylneuraminic acid synthetase
MKHDLSVVGIIPAKTDSTRLLKKNLQVINGKTLLEHSLDYAKNSEYIKTIIVSTESDEVRKICEKYDDIIVLGRPEHLLKDAEVADVYVDIFQNLNDNVLNVTSGATHMVALQPDHPDRTRNIDDMLDYFVDNTYDDLVTVDSSGTRNGSIRITKAQYVRDGSMSRRVGSMLDDCTNIHSEEDLKQAERNIQNNE